ncbi:MAG TPA: TonB-dependent receptor [Candidatus Kapabacteria bacterium]|nr:TonB-dependent receptor [Candidatus Kapabacteria bacterium]
MKKILSLTIFLPVVLALLFSSVHAQTTENLGSIRGRIVDKDTRQPLIGASVVLLSNTQEGPKLGARTNNEGVFTIKNVPEDLYKLRISSMGYLTFIETDVRVIRNKATQIEDIALVGTKIEGDTAIVTTSLTVDDPIRPVSNYQYSAGEIRRSPGAAGDIFRAIETLPGVSGSGGEYSAFSVRGGSPRENIILVDNIPVDKTSHMEGGNEAQDAQGGRFSIFSPVLIEQADFQGGGFGARYGGKNASVIELKIKEGNQENITADARYDVLGWEVNYNGPTYLPSTSTMLSVRHNDFKNILKMIDQEEQGHPWFTDVIMKTTTEIDANNKVSLLGIYADEWYTRDMRHVVLSKNYSGTDLYTVDRIQAIGGLNWRTLIGDESFANFTAYIRQSNWAAQSGEAFFDSRTMSGRTLGESDFARRDSIYLWDDKERELGLKSDMTFQLGSTVLLNAGAQVSHFDLDILRAQRGIDTIYSYDQNDPRTAGQNFIIRDPRFGNAHKEEEVLNTAAYLELPVNATDAFTITPGARWDYSDFNAKHYVSPRLSMNYKFDQETSLSFGSGIYYQLPEINSMIFSADKSVENERAIHAILSFKTIVTEGLRLTVEPYYKKFDDLIARKDRVSREFANTGDGYAMGVDFGLLKRLDDQWYGQLNYSYGISKRRDREEQEYYNSDFNQPHVFNLLVGYEYNKNWQFSAKWKYATGRPTDSYIIHNDVHGLGGPLRYSQEITEENGERLDDFHTLNVRVDRRIQWGSLAIVAFLDVLNVYGRLNVNEARFLETDGTIDPRGFTIIPTFGLKLEI